MTAVLATSRDKQPRQQ